MRLEGKIALITGAATGVEGTVKGIGGASARLFSSEGATVFLTDVDEEPGRRTAAQIRDAGGDAVFRRLDVTSEADWSAVVDEVTSTHGRLDILVNNAGTPGAGPGQGTVEETTTSGWDATMAVHAKSVFLGTRHAVPALRLAGSGSIVNISSIWGIAGSPGAAAYHAAKGAIRAFTKAAALQYARDNIRVNSIHPGHVLTPMTASRYEDPEFRDDRLASTPLGRIAEAMDIAYGILYLASDESSFVTGAELVIDGGYLAQ